MRRRSVRKGHEIVEASKKAAPIPNAIPEVQFDKDGEPFIVREVLVHPSPIPRAVAAIVISLAVASAGYTVWGQAQRDKDRKAQDVKNELLFTKLEQQQKQSDEEREALRQLFLGVLSAKTPQEVAALLRKFTEQERRNQQRNPQPSPGASPTPSPSPRTTQHRPAPQPSPSPSPSHTPSPRPTPSPTPSSSVCVYKPVKVCV